MQLFFMQLLGQNMQLAQTPLKLPKTPLKLQKLFWDHFFKNGYTFHI